MYCPNRYISNKSVLPSNHQELWNNSIPDPKNPNVRWAREGEGVDAIYHRFQSDDKDGVGSWHWNGSTRSKTQKGKDTSIPIQNVPNFVKKAKIKI